MKKGGWDIVWVFSRKEDNSGNVTIIIFVAKTNTLPAHGAETFSFITEGGRKLSSVFHLRGMFLVVCDRVSLSFASSHMFLLETLNSTPLFPMP